MPMPLFPQLTPGLVAAWQAAVGPDTTKPIKDQHVVSAVVLRQFHDPHRGKLERLNVKRPEAREKLVNAKRTGFARDFLTYATVSAEARWQAIENDLPAALAAIDSGSEPLSDEHRATIMGIVALHMARNIRYSAVHDTTWRELVDRERARSLTDPQLVASLRREFRERYGLHAAGAESLGTAYDGAVQEAVDNQLPDRVARFQVELKFFQLSAWLRHASFQLLQPEGGEFIIGDSPTVLLDHDRQRFSGVWDLGLDSATHLAMPLRPDLAVRVALDGGGQFTLDRIDETSVGEANELQVRTALHYVFYRPAEKRRQFVRRVLRRPSSRAA
jgi:hypothetical protein